MVALACLFGNLCVHQLAHLPDLQSCLLLIPIGLLALWYPAFRYVAWAIVAFIWTASYAQFRLIDRLPGSLSGQDFAVSGWIDGFVDLQPDRAVFSLRVEQSASDAVPGRVRLTWYDPPAAIEPGENLSLTVRLRSPRGLANPGSFDYERWLFLESYGATGYVRAGEVVARPRWILGQSWLIFRHDLAQKIAAAVTDSGAAALITALTLGERSGFSDRHWRTLRRTGTSHLVAISGMHVGLIALLLFGLTRWTALRLPPICAMYDIEIAAAFSALGAIAYAALAGFALPTERAVLMIVIALAIALKRKPTGFFGGLAAALIIVLGIDPLAPLSSSFWLSFAAVGLLLWLASSEDLHRSRHGFGTRVVNNFRLFTRLQFGITLGLAPFVGAFFAEISLVSPLVNFVAIPLFSFALVPLALLAALSVYVGGLGSYVIDLAGAAAALTWVVLDKIAQWPYAAMSVAEPDSWALVIALCGALCAMPAHPLPGRRLAWLAVLPMALSNHDQIEYGTARVLVMDVGHGLAVLIETADHKLLYDAGPVYRSGFDAGQEIVVPTLMRRGHLDLDMLIISHSDIDHAGGAGAVLDTFPSVRVLHGPDVDRIGGMDCVAGQGWTWDGIRFSVLHPSADFVGDDNDSSCVLKISTGQRSVLLTGDIEAHAESRLVTDAAAIAADIVLVPHHGSATSSSARFIAATGAQLALVSAGFANRWGFPKVEVRERWRESGAHMIVTGESGALSFTLGEKDFVWSTQRAASRRYWHAERPITSG